MLETFFLGNYILLLAKIYVIEYIAEERIDFATRYSSPFIPAKFTDIAETNRFENNIVTNRKKYKAIIARFLLLVFLL